MARPRFHTLATAPLAWALYRRWGLPGALGTIAMGTFVDLDHLVDYAWTRLRGAKSHYFAPLHGWELAIAISVLALLAKHAADTPPPPQDGAGRAGPGRDFRLQTSDFRPGREDWRGSGLAGALAGLGAGLWLHLLQDLVTNRPRHAGVYALTYRLRHGFRREITGWDDKTNFHAWSHKPWYLWF
jgi:hypothetical protein